MLLAACGGKLAPESQITEVVAINAPESPDGGGVTDAKPTTGLICGPVLSVGRGTWSVGPAFDLGLDPSFGLDLTQAAYAYATDYAFIDEQGLDHTDLLLYFRFPFVPSGVGASTTAELDITLVTNQAPNTFPPPVEPGIYETNLQPSASAEQCTATTGSIQGINSRHPNATVRITTRTASLVEGTVEMDNGGPPATMTFSVPILDSDDALTEGEICCLK